MLEEIVSGAFASVTPDLDGIYRSTHTWALDDWRISQQALVTGTGASSVAIPGLHLVGMGADLAFLMNRMSVCSYGVGAILGHRAGLGNILEKEDFTVILSRWSGDDSLSNAAIAKTAVGLAGHVGGATITKLLAKTAVQNAGILVGKKLGAKVTTKVATKFGSKLLGKAAGGFFPFLGPVIGGGVNLWFITSVTTEAEAWYRLKISLQKKE